MSKVALLRSFLANPAQVGALCPSSPELCRTIVRGIGIEAARTVVELGPGTGVITCEILPLLGSDAKCFAVELDEKLCCALKRRFPALSVHHDSAANLHQILRCHDRHPAEVIVSGLPWAIFPDELQLEILESVIASLAPGGCFTTFAYVQGLLLPAGRRFRKRLHELFDTVETSQVVWCNLPPAFVYRCRSRGTK